MEYTAEIDIDKVGYRTMQDAVVNIADAAAYDQDNAHQGGAVKVGFFEDVIKAV